MLFKFGLDMPIESSVGGLLKNRMKATTNSSSMQNNSGGIVKVLPGNKDRFILKYWAADHKILNILYY